MSSQESDDPRVADAGGSTGRTSGPDDEQASAGRDSTPGRESPPDREPSPTRVEEIAKLLLGAAGLVVLVGLLSIIPPLERTVPATPDGVFVTFETLVTGLVTVVIVGLFLVVADELEALVVERLPGRDPLVADAGAVVKYLVVFLVLVAAYGPLAAVATPFLTPSDTVWVFDLAYVLVTLVPLGVAASIVVGDLDELASLFVDAFRSASERVESGSASERVESGSAGRAGDVRHDDHRSDDDRTGEEPTVSPGGTDVETGDDAGQDERPAESTDEVREDGADPAEPAAEDPVEAGPDREE